MLFLLCLALWLLAVGLFFHAFPVASFFCLCVVGLLYDVCFVLVCSSSFLVLVPRESCASWLWYFLGISTYIFVPVRCPKLFWWSLSSIVVTLLRDRQYENMPIQIYWKFYHQKWKFSYKKKNLIFFYISAQNIDSGYSLEPPRRGGSNEYPQSMFWTEIRKNNIYFCKPQFYYIKVGFKGGQTYIGMFSWWLVALFFLSLAVACVLSVMICSLFILVLLVSYVLWLWLSLLIFYLIFIYDAKAS